MWLGSTVGRQLSLMRSAFLDYPHERTEFADANYAALGRALAFATSFEAVCRSLSSLQHIRRRVEDLRSSDADADTAFAIAVAEVWDQRLRQHVKRILEYHEFPADIAETVKRAKAARNEIAHEITLGTARIIQTDEGRTNLLSRLSHLARSIADGFIIVELISLVETHEPLPRSKFLATYPIQLTEWVSQP